MKTIVAGVVLGLGLTPFFVRPVPQPQALQLAPVPHVPIDGYRPIRRIGADGNALPGDEIRWGDVLPVFRNITAR